MAPLAAPLLYLLANAVRGVAGGAEAHAFRFKEAAVILGFGAIMSSVAAIFIGIPAVAVLAYAGELTRTRTLAIGFVAGLAVAQVMQASQQGAFVPVWFPYWFGAVGGAASAGLWWRIARA